MDNRLVRQAVAGVVALVGGYLLYVSATPQSDFGAVLASFWIGAVLFAAIAWVLLRYYRPGTDQPSVEEVGVSEWRLMRFLRYGREAAPLYLGLRLFLALEWVQAGLHKLGDPRWVSTGDALRGFWVGAVAVPAPPAGAPITYLAYRSVIQFMLDNSWYAWFGKLVAGGEVLVGLGFLFGGLIGFAAFFGLLMNFSYIFAGATSSNPMLIMLGVVILYGWRVAGWWGVDRFLLSRIGTPWAMGRAGRGRTVIT